ncbi:MAG: hypothetical protein CMH83_19345 [Nocardioides sp.]|nr:hypothetical protein [Nocardioides sp.]
MSRRRRGRWWKRAPRVRVGTLNLSVRAAKRKPQQLEDDLVDFMAAHDVVGMQEAGQARKVVEAAAKRAGHVVWFGDGRPGQDATPISIRRDFSEHAPRFHAVLLSERTDAGRGAGPRMVKAKWLMIVETRVPGRVVAVGNMHGPASQQNLGRRLLAARGFRRAGKVMATLYPSAAVFVIGDLNTVPGARQLAGLLARGLRSCQRRLGELVTHGRRRTIDDVYFRRRVVRPLRHHTTRTVSDHRGYGVTCAVRPRTTKKG